MLTTMIGISFRGQRYVVRSEAALIALVTWLQLADVDEQRAA
jgi:hypothetical protein